MASAEIALVYDLKVRVSFQDRVCMNSDADETLAASPAFFKPWFAAQMWVVAKA